ncbi:MAG: VWA domain-containing protein [Bdellovibrionales bacterium]|nr:VWA domain-containing protein [Bdellovibrionales bacterium]
MVNSNAPAVWFKKALSVGIAVLICFPPPLRAVDQLPSCPERLESVGIRPESVKSKINTYKSVTLSVALHLAAFAILALPAWHIATRPEPLLLSTLFDDDETDSAIVIEMVAPNDASAQYSPADGQSEPAEEPEAGLVRRLASLESEAVVTPQVPNPLAKAPDPPPEPEPEPDPPPIVEPTPGPAAAVASSTPGTGSSAAEAPPSEPAPTSPVPPTPPTAASVASLASTPAAGGARGSATNVQTQGLNDGLMSAIEGAAAHAREDQPLNVVIAVDVTGSMTPYIESIKVNMHKLIDTLEKVKARGIPVRVGVMTFSDYQAFNPPYWIQLDLCSDFTRLRQDFTNKVQLHTSSANHDIPESPLDALVGASRGFSWDRGAKATVIIISDAAWKPNTADGRSKETVLRELQSHDPPIFVQDIHVSQ